MGWAAGRGGGSTAWDSGVSCAAGRHCRAAAAPLPLMQTCPSVSTCLPPCALSARQELKAKEQIAQLKGEISSLTKLLEQVGGGGLVSAPSAA